MALREILTYTHPALRSQTVEVTQITPEIRTLIDDMYETMEEAYGVGLAAPQVGELIRLFVYDVGEDGPQAVINPTIVRSTGEETGNEGCLSIPRLQGDVSRATRLTVTWMDEKGRQHKKTVKDFTARVFQHEIDHLHGVLFTDRALPETLHMAEEKEPDREKHPAAGRT